MGLMDNLSAAVGGHEDQVKDGIDEITDLVDAVLDLVLVPSNSGAEIIHQAHVLDTSFRPTSAGGASGTLIHAGRLCDVNAAIVTAKRPVRQGVMRVWHL